MPIGPFGEALMRYSRTPTPGVGARFGMRPPNADAIRQATPTPGAIKPSEAASEAALPPEIKAYLKMMTGQPGAAPPSGPVLPSPMPPAPELPAIGPEVSPIEPPIQALPPTVSRAVQIRAPRPPDVDLETLAITAPDESWQAAFYDRNGRRAGPADYEMRAFALDQIARTGTLPTKAEWLFQRFRNFDAEPSGLSEFG